MSIIENQQNLKVTSKRNYSFLKTNQERFDSVIDGDEEFIIPASPGSTYWAIIRYMYENHDRPMRMQDIVNGASVILEDRDMSRWLAFKNKAKVKFMHNGKLVEKEASSWQSRLETNVKNILRLGENNPYGQRFIERGHIFRIEPNVFGNKKGYILRTTTNKRLPKIIKVKNNVDKIQNASI